MLITLFGKPAKRRPNTTGSRTAPKPYLSDSQWVLIADLFPHPPVSRKGGRPRIPPRECLEGVIFIMRTGCGWDYLPNWYPSPATCWRRLDEWTRTGIFEKAWHRLLGKLDALKQIQWNECMADATFSPAKKGGKVSA